MLHFCHIQFFTYYRKYAISDAAQEERVDDCLQANVIIKYSTGYKSKLPKVRE